MSGKGSSTDQKKSAAATTSQASLEHPERSDSSSGQAGKKRQAPPCKSIGDMLHVFKKTHAWRTHDMDAETFDRKSKEHRERCNIKPDGWIWLDGEMILRPKMTTSYGILLYRKAQDVYQYLLGLIPQGNAWTVFKGLPDNESETPEQTAMREFKEETSMDFPYSDWKAVKKTDLYGRTSNKLLQIYLVQAPDNFEINFDVNQVVKIDSGYMQGKPEIVEIQFLTKQQAMEGTMEGGKLAKIYKSQIGILEHAEMFLKGQEIVQEAQQEIAERHQNENGNEEE